MVTHLENERTLLAEAREGNAESFGILVNQYYGNIYRLAFKVTGSKEDAEDVLQDSILKAFSSLSRFHGHSRFYTWLVRIALNEALMKLRKRRTVKQVSLNDWAELNQENSGNREIEDRDQNPETHYAKVELQQHLNSALEGLGPGLSRVFVLRNVQELSPGEVAELLGLSVSGVKSRLLRARMKLRQRLARIFEPEKLVHRTSGVHSSNGGREAAGAGKCRMSLRVRTADAS